MEAASGIKVADIKSIREGEIVGDHSVSFESAEDVITISHHAKNRDIFAKGSLVAAKFLEKKKKACLTCKTFWSRIHNNMRKFINNFRIQQLIKNSKFEKAGQLLNKIELSNGLSPESVSLYRDLCLEGTIIELYAQSGKLFSKGRYKESREMLEELRKIIIVNAEKLGTGKSELNNFFETVISEFQNTYSVDNISLEEIKPLRVKFQQMAKEIFPNKFGKEYSEILVDVLLMPSICKAFEK